MAIAKVTFSTTVENATTAEYGESYMSLECTDETKDCPILDLSKILETKITKTKDVGTNGFKINIFYNANSPIRRRNVNDMQKLALDLVKVTCDKCQRSRFVNVIFNAGGWKNTKTICKLPLGTKGFASVCPALRVATANGMMIQSHVYSKTLISGAHRREISLRDGAGRKKTGILTDMKLACAVCKNCYKIK